MKVMHLIAAGNTGGIQTLIKEYASLSQLDNNYVFAWGGGSNEEAMREAGANTVCLDAHKVGSLKVSLDIIKLFINEKPVAVVVHSSPLLRYLAVIMHRLNKNTRIYFYCHSAMTDQLGQYHIVKRTIYNYINRLCIRHATKVIAISEYVKTTILKYYKIPQNKIRVVYNAVNVQKFDTPLHISTDLVKFVFIGRLIKVKGVQIAMKALVELSNSIQWEFNVVGDGPYRKELEKTAIELEIADKVFFHGNRFDIPDLLSQMDIFLHVCTCEEGFGIGIIEAMMTGKLCICSNSGAIPEIITDKKDGFLVEKNKVDELADLINEIVSKKNGWKGIQLEAKSTAEKFSTDKFVYNLDALLSET